MYYDLAWGRIEDRDDSGCVLRQYVWGARYVDNVLEIGINTDPADDEEGPQTNQCLCEDFYYPVQDANFNVVGLVDSAGTLLERYEYTPYGERTVYGRSGSDDTITSAPLYESQRVLDSSLQPQAYSLCDLGHQGLFLDKEFSAYDNRYRVLSPPLARFLQRDPIGYADGMGLYEYCRGSPVRFLDAGGTYCGDCQPPASQRDNAYDIRASGAVVTPGTSTPSDQDWEDAKTGISIIKGAAAVRAIASSAAGTAARGGSAVTGAMKGAASVVAKGGMSSGLTDACYEGVDKIADTATETGTAAGGVSMYVKVSYKSCDPCTSGWPHTWFTQCYEMRGHETEPYKCTQGTGKGGALGGPFGGIEAYPSKAEALKHEAACQETARRAVRSGLLR